MVKQQAGRERTGLEVRLAERQHSNREARSSKITAADLQRRAEERRAARSASSRPAPAGRGIRNVSLVIGAALLIGAGCVALSTSNASASFTEQTQRNEEAIAKAKGDLADIPASDKAAASKYAAEVQQQIAAATTKGREVAVLQQDFQRILAGGNDEHSDNGAATPASAAAAAHRKLLAPYFVDRALIVNGQAAYAPGSTLPFQDNEIDPRFAWHVAYDESGLRAKDPGDSTWALASVTATATPGVLEATWADRRSGDDDLLAWATASYYTSEGKFGSLRLGQTSLGSGDPTNDQKGNG